HFDPGICRLLALLAGDFICVDHRVLAVHVGGEAPRLQVLDRHRLQEPPPGRIELLAGSEEQPPVR
ncbi:MAG: hypothetical protein JWQ49_3114, partial [Edaphobacter sp.]|nr:hypothetical protein [Edaphobacter sp.]